MKNLFAFLLAGMVTVLSAQTIPNLPIPIGAGTAEVWNDSIYFFGGANRWAGTIRYPRIYKFDGSSWSYLDSIPDNNVWDVESVLAGDDVYLLAGWPSGAPSIRKYNLPNGGWTYLNSSPNASPYGSTAEHLNGFIYLFNRVGNVHEYDIANNSWSTRMPNATPGYDLSSVLYQDEVYIAGFYDSTFYKYSPAADNWMQLANTPYQIAGCAMGVIGDKIYCAAGSPQGSPSEMRQTVLAYDIAGNYWSEESFQITGRRILMADVLFQNEFYILGGFDTTSFAVDIVEEIVPMGPVGLDEMQEIPRTVSLEQNYPNPFNPTTTIKFAIPEAAEVNLSIYDIIGQTVKTLIDKNLPAGRHSILWDGKNDTGDLLSSGIYLYRMQYMGKVQTKRMVLIR